MNTSTNELELINATQDDSNTALIEIPLAEMSLVGGGTMIYSDV